MSAPVPAPGAFVPAVIALSRRSGTTVHLRRMPNLALWAVRGHDGTMVVGPRPGQRANPGDRELVGHITAAVAAIGGGLPVHATGHTLRQLLAGVPGLEVSGLAPAPQDSAEVHEAVDGQRRHLLGEVVVATDASLARNGNTAGLGWVLHFPNGADAVVGSGGHGCKDITVAELIAIRKALTEVVRVCNEGTERIRVTVLSDSRNALEAITEGTAAGMSGSHPNAVRSELAQIEALAPRLDVAYQWVKGHSGHVLNEYADRLAVMARRNREFGIEPSTRTEILAGIRESVRSDLADVQGDAIALAV